MSETQTDWQIFREAESSAEDSAREWVAENPGVDPDTSDDFDRFAHETADGSMFVIYHWRALAIYAAASEVRDYAEEYAGMVGGDADMSIEAQASAIVYLWMRAKIMEEARNLYAEAQA